MLAMKKPKKKAARASSKARGGDSPADLCRVVVFDKELGRWTSRSTWQKESDLLHRLAARFSAMGYEAYVVARGVEPPTPTVTKRNPKVDQWRYVFDDGVVEYLDKAFVDAEGHAQLSQLLRMRRETHEAAEKARSESIRAKLEEQRKTAGLDNRDEKIRSLAVEERRKQQHGYLQRVGKQFGISASAVSKVLRRKTQE
jgi:hypothetical protein